MRDPPVPQQDAPGAAAAGAELLDCAHVGVFAGVCQYNRCAKRLCANCVASCEACGKVICLTHQVILGGRQRVFCPPDARRYLGTRLAVHLLGGR